MKSVLLIVSALSVLMLSACANKQPAETTPNTNDEAPAMPPSTAATITDKHWKLVALEGAVVKPMGDSARHAHMILHTTDSRVTGNGGCNSYSGQYTLGEGNAIDFTQIAATKMACDQMAAESVFFTALEAAENYAVQNDTLSLHKTGMPALARFILVP